MTSAHLALRRRMTVAEAMAAVHKLEPESEEIYQLFVVDQFGKLRGEISFRQLIMADPNALLQDIMAPEVISVQAGADREEAARTVSRYDLLAVPVLDQEGVLLGVITVDDVLDVLSAEATEDIQRLGGAQPLDQAYFLVSMPGIVRKRIGWLLLLFVANTFTGTVLRAFEDELATAVALAFFIPLIIGTGGNTGSQTVTTIVRALALGEVRFRDLPRVIGREATVGLFLGLLLSVIGFARALTWDTGPSIALVVAVTLVVVVIWSNLVAAVVPMGR
jgi:magnesium transporter